MLVRPWSISFDRTMLKTPRTCCTINPPRLRFARFALFTRTLVICSYDAHATCRPREFSYLISNPVRVTLQFQTTWKNINISFLFRPLIFLSLTVYVGTKPFSLGFFLRSPLHGEQEQNNIINETRRDRGNRCGLSDRARTVSEEVEGSVRYNTPNVSST